MKTILQFSFVLFIFNYSIFICSSQNLVSNPSFEVYSNCPDAAYCISYATGWSAYKLSPDYFNTCATTPLVTVPDNLFGNQIPASGNAYCGILNFLSNTTYGIINYREYVGSKLITQLIIGEKYYVSFKVNLGGIREVVPSNCACNNFGVRFLNRSYHAGDEAPITNYAHINNTSIITDSVNWTRIFGSFVPDSSYQYFMIGNFFDGEHTDTLILNNEILCKGAYYFIDDVCVSTDSIFSANYSYTSINVNNKQTFLSIYPNPVSDFINIDFISAIKYYEVEIFDILGQQVLKQKNTEQHLILDISDISEGFFLIKISFDNENIYYKILKQ